MKKERKKLIKKLINCCHNLLQEFKQFPSYKLYRKK